MIFASQMFAVSAVTSAITSFAWMLFAVKSFVVVSHKVVSHTTCRFQSTVAFPPNSISVVHQHKSEKSHSTTVQLESVKL